MAATKLFLVVKTDTVIQATSYLVRAHDADHAKDLIDAGMYIEETKPETLDTIASETSQVTELQEHGIGQER
jgi:hypothetical protein